MEITYIGHSGFLLEWETCYWLFDYYIGDIPEMDPAKKIFVFASHKHEDHYNPMIFSLYNKYQDIEYILSSDIYPKKTKLEITEEIQEKIRSVKPSEKYVLYDNNKKEIILNTLKSTDCGVAFLLEYQGKTIYHAGDLNLWVWREETKQYNNNMTARFQREMSMLKDIPIDIAFAPLDPRQEEDYDKGLECLLNTAKIKYAFPMHFGNNPSIITKFKKDRVMHLNHTEVIEIYQNGQKWLLEI